MNQLAVQQEKDCLKRIRILAFFQKSWMRKIPSLFSRTACILAFPGLPKGTRRRCRLLLADHVERNGLAGKMRFNVYTGASIGIDVDDRWAELSMLDRRWPHQQGVSIRKAINAAEINFSDRLSFHVRTGFRLWLLYAGQWRQDRHRHYRGELHYRGRRHCPDPGRRHRLRNCGAGGKDHHRDQHPDTFPGRAPRLRRGGSPPNKKVYRS